MNLSLLKVIQGGMGAGVSSWRLARAVSALGQLGVVAGTALNQIMARRLQQGDIGGHVRRALDHFPFPSIAKRIIDNFYQPDGKPERAAYRAIPMPALAWAQSAQEMCIAANFVEVFLAKEGHDHPVGINYLEKIQLTLLPSIYGAMLAGVAVVIIGAGIPLEIPAVLEGLATAQGAVAYPIRVAGTAQGLRLEATFDPRAFLEQGMHLPALARPEFLPIVSSDALAGILLKKASGPISGFIVEGSLAGGHNAPPRGRAVYTDDGQPVYGPRDLPDLETLRKIGLPFWLAGACGSPAKLRQALEQGACGIQVGTLFALSDDSGLAPEVRTRLVQGALAGQAKVFTDPLASPTGFPFKVAQLAGTLSEAAVYEQRQRVCDLGYLREPYMREDGTVGYRCAAEPVAAYLAKSGQRQDIVGRKCLCNALIANIGYPQPRALGREEPCLITLGDDLSGVPRLCSHAQPHYSAADVVRYLLG